MSRAQAITAAAMFIVGVALVVWTLIGDLGMRWGVIGSVLLGFTAVEVYLMLLDDEQRRPVRTRLYLLTPLISGGIFAAAVIQERPDPVPGAVLAEGGSAIGSYDGGALTWGMLDGLARTANGHTRPVGDDDDSFFDPPVLATENVVIDSRRYVVTSYDPVSGKERWSRRIPYFDVFRRYGDLLVYEGDGYTAALEITSGEDRWRRVGGPTLGNGGLIVTGTDRWWDLNFTSGMHGLIDQVRYVGIRDTKSYRHLAVVDVTSGKVVRTEPFAFQRDPFAIAGDFLYTADSDGARAISLVGDGPPRPVAMRPHDNSADVEEPDRLFESKYPGFIGAMPDAWQFPEKPDITIDRNATGRPAFPVVSASGEQAVWFAGSPRVVRIEDAYEEILAYAYDDGTYLQLVTDRDAVGTRVHRLDVVRGRTVASYAVAVDTEAEPTLSLRNGLACVGGECRRLTE
ncbi:PQQ-binding-like beta-propeller repeat protein [Nocardioides albertanoniae]|nr:PQQ-binding-like beta-propeller repeat protein [Nocardioides albertanoniae]